MPKKFESVKRFDGKTMSFKQPKSVASPETIRMPVFDEIFGAVKKAHLPQLAEYMKGEDIAVAK